MTRTDRLDTQETAEMCHTSPETLRYWRHLGKGPLSYKLGRRVVYDRADVERWIDEQKQATACR